jgi:hypothetical protein
LTSYSSYSVLYTVAKPAECQIFPTKFQEGAKSESIETVKEAQACCPTPSPLALRIEDKDFSGIKITKIEQ